MHDYHSIKGRFVSILIGLMLIIIPVIITGLIIEYGYIHFDEDNGWVGIGAFLLPFEVFLGIVCAGPLFGLVLILSGLLGGTSIVYFCCEKCGGKLLDSKTLRTKLGHQSNHEKALTIENLLEDCDYGGRECPTCEAKMKIVELDYERHTTTGKRNIELDGCIECSHIWFDKSEFRKILGEAKTKSLKLNLNQSEKTQIKKKDVYRKIDEI